MEKMHSQPVKISDIKHPMKNIRVTGKMGDKRTILNPHKKRAVAFLSDGTGRILLNLWREQVDQVKEGDTVYLMYAFTKKGVRGMTLSTWEEVIQKKKPRNFGA
jgi:hypothetical protein